MKQKTLHGYELWLRRLIEGRTGEPCAPWIHPQILTAASGLVMLDKVRGELLAADLCQLATGSTGQQKSEVNPLLPYFDKLTRNLTAQFEALGLNYLSTPRKMTDSTRKDGAEGDRLGDLLATLKEP